MVSHTVKFREFYIIRVFITVFTKAPPQFVPILSQINPIHVASVEFFKINLSMPPKIKIQIDFLISKFRHVLNVVCFLLGNSAAAEF